MSSAPTPANELSPLKRALLALDRMQAELDAAKRARHEPLAVIGMGCRFPQGADDPAAFWQLLRDGIDAVSEVPRERWDIDAYYSPDPDAPGKMYTRWGGFLRDVDQFDPQFFGITPREAASLDPQQRLLLEVTWEALENAGQAPDGLRGTPTGVFVGILSSDYGDLQLAGDGVTKVDAYFGSGTARSLASGRLSYVLGLQGPSISIDTACSSSLVALHLACASLRSGESRVAIAAGVNLMLMPEPTIALSRYRMMAADGRCKTFDKRADGYVRGEGCAVLVLKTLATAQADGDRVLAVIRGTAVNQDGASSGLTAPNGPAQEAVIRAALKDGAVSPEQVGYVETHGTGTALGDPIEIQALANALGGGARPPNRPVIVGTIKTNIGHTEAVAGLAGVVKTILCLQHRQIPRHLHLQERNPLIPWDRLPVAIPLTTTPWPSGAPLIAGVSSFGFSGTNAHVVLEAAPEVTPVVAAVDRPLHVLTLSARSEETLRHSAARYADALEAGAGDAGAGARWPDVCFTANVGRVQFAHRAVVIAADTPAALPQLRNLAAGMATEGARWHVRAKDRPDLVWLFTGQGAQYPEMGRVLYETQPTFRRALDKCDELIRAEAGFSIIEVIHNGGDGRLDQTQFTQPALFSIEYALAELWRSWGVEPSAVLGHSVGEYTAAYVAGVFSLPDAVKLVVARARLMQSLPAGGCMAALPLDAERAMQAIGPRAAEVAIAAINAPNETVISGAGPAVQAIVDELAASGISARTLRVSHAFHSPLMAPILDEFERIAATVRYSPPKLRLVANLTGQVAPGTAVATAAYWRAQLGGAVRFAAGIATLAQQGCKLFLELGPGGVLTSAGRQSAPQATFVSTIRRGGDEWRQTIDALVTLYGHGVTIDWRRFDGDYARRRTTLPTTPFERARHWIAPRSSATRPVPGAHDDAPILHPLLHRQVSSPLDERQFESVLDATILPVLADHQVQGVSILPATAFMEMTLAAGRYAGMGSGGETPAIESLVIHAPMPFATGEQRAVQVLVARAVGGEAPFKVFSRALHGVDGTSVRWVLHAQGKLLFGLPPAAAARVDLETLRVRCPSAIDAEQHYAELRRRGYDFGPSLRGVRAIRRGEREALGEIELPEAARNGSSEYLIPPALLDACLQFCWTLLPTNAGNDTYLPLSMNMIRVYRSPPARVFSHAVIRGERAGPETLTVDVRVIDADGAIVVELSGILLQRAPRAALTVESAPTLDEWLYELRWDPKPLAERPTAPPAAVPQLRLGEIRTSVDERLEPLAAAHRLARHRELIDELERLSFGYIVDALGRLGAIFAPDTQFVAGELATRLGVLPKYGRLFDRLLDVLAEEGVLVRSGGAWLVRKAPDAIDTRNLRDRLLADHASGEVLIDLTARCGVQLAEAITGRADPLALLFPGGSLDLAERLYRELPEAQVYNELAATAVAGLARQLPPDRPLRIIELGAGTGGLTGYVLAQLPAERTEYWFTDVSPVFLARAKRKLEKYPFVRYSLCDAERPCAEQGLEPGTFDIVIAANALHATRDMRRTMSNARALLKPNGAAVLLEGTGPERWIDITFGLTDGWWAFTDTALRPSYPLLARATWIKLLADVGFAEADTAPSAMHLSRQAIVVARNGASAKTPERSRWVLFADGDFAEALKRELSARAIDSVVVRAGAGGIDLTRPQDVAAALQGAGPVRGIVYACAVDAAEPQLWPVASLEPIERRVCGGLLHIVQALGATSADAPPRVHVVTRGAQAVGGETTLSPAQATLLGFCKVVDLEHPELACVRVDLDPDRPLLDQALHVAQEIVAEDRENQVAYRSGKRCVARLAPVVATAAARVQHAVPADAMLLCAAPSGVLDELRWVAAERRSPGRGEVEIRVHASGLAFRDVLNALAMRRDADPLGSEVSGVVSAVGPGVTGIAIGDAVVALATGALASYVIASADLVAPKPANLSAEEAVTLPTAAVTALHALCNVAGLKAGETVLIHAAAGGVGLTAVQIAMQLGATVIATAGSEAKRAYLRSLGVAHVFSSRSIEFAERSREVTAGRGVDVVLNSLAGEFIDASFSALARGGRFLEIGKRDIWSSERAADVRPDAVYRIIDLASGGTESKETLGEVFRDVLARAERGELRPLPLRAYPWHAAPAAFRDMAQARHIGKIVITQPLPNRDQRRFRQDGSYLITGGLGGLGLLTAQWLVEHGASHLVLVGRREPAPAAREAIAALEARGAEVLVMLGDVSDATRMQQILATAERTLPPLRGVIHSAGVLDDGVLLRQDWRRFAGVLAPKVDGAWNLHALTLTKPLEFFVLYSSLAGVMGSPGQANHAAANAFLDALAQERRLRGWPALSIDWGVWSEIGSAAERRAGERVGKQGVATIAPAQGLRVLERLLDHAGSQVAVLPVDWPVYLRQFGPSAPAWLSAVGARAPTATAAAALAASPRAISAPAAGSPPAAGSLIEQLTALPAHRRLPLVEARVTEQVARVIGLDPSRAFDPEQPLSEIGLDSLMAVELRNRLAAVLQLERGLPATLVFDYPTVGAIARHLLSDVFALGSASVPDPTRATDAGPADLLSAIEQLSDDAVEKML